MKNLFFYLVMCLAQIGFGQNYVDKKPVVSATGLESQNEQLNLISNTQKTGIQNFTGNNAVFIEQVGFGNIVNAQVSSDDSLINIYQEGCHNVTGLQLNAVKIRENIIQQGFSNLVLDYSVHGAQLHQVDVSQRGNYNTTISAGRNSISERLRVNQQGTGSTVLVIHY